MKHAVVLSACAVVLASPAHAADEPKPQTLVIAAPECLVTSVPPAPGSHKLVGALVAILAPVVVEIAIDAAVDGLKKVRTETSEGSLDFNLWRRPTDEEVAAQVDRLAGEEKTRQEQIARRQLAINLPRCVTVVTGRFSGATSKFLEKVNTTTAVNAGDDGASLRKRLSDNKIAVTQLFSVLETNLVLSADGTAFHYQPVYYRNDSLLPGNSSKKQGIVYNFSLRGPGAAPWGTVHSLAPVTLGEIAAPTVWHGGSRGGLDKAKTGALVMPGMSETAYLAYLRDWKQSSIAEFMPVNLQVALVQTQKPSDAAKFAASVLEKAKPKIVERVGKELDPDGPFNERQASLDAEIAWKEAEQALTVVRAALPVNQAAIDIAQLKADKAKAKYENLR